MHRVIVSHILVVLMVVPPSAWAQPSTSAQSPIAVSEDLKPGSRLATLQKLHESSWQMYAILNHQIPGVLFHKAPVEQVIFSPYHDCSPGPLTQDQLKQAGTATLDALLAQAQTAVASYLEGRKQELGLLEFEDARTQGTVLPNIPLSVGEARCLPAPYFTLPAPYAKEQWSMKREEKRLQGKLSSPLMSEPLYVPFTRKDESAPLTTEEVKALVQWVAWLREFRNSQALYESFHKGRKQIAAPPDFTVSQEVGKKLDLLYKGDDQALTRTYLKDESKKPRLTSAQITADKIYEGTALLESQPHFVPCGAQWCLQDGKQEELTALDEKSVLALQSSSLSPGAYLDALILLAKRSSVMELIAVNGLLPEKLRFKQLPEVCRVEDASPSLIGETGSEFERVLQDHSTLTERQWWVSQVGMGLQQYVLQAQLHEAPPISIFPATPSPGAANLYEQADALVRKFVVDFFAKISAPEGYLSTWNTLGETVLARTKESAFSQSLSDRLGQEDLNDFTSLLGEQLLVMFASAREQLETKLTGENWDSRKEIITELIRKTVEQALIDSLAQYVQSFMPEGLFVTTGIGGVPMLLIDKPTERAGKFWEQYFEFNWREIVRDQGFADTQAIAEVVVQRLFETPALQAAQKQSTRFDADTVARKEVRTRLKARSTEMEEAVRAEETIEYLISQVNWGNSVAYNLLPGKGNYWSEIAGKYNGEAPACFYIKDDKGHGYGRNTFGSLNPLLPPDYEHLKKGLASMAARYRKQLTERFEKRYTKEQLQKLGVHSHEQLADAAVMKFITILDAKDEVDAGRVAGILTAEFTDLSKWLKGRSAESWYLGQKEKLVKQAYDSSLKPLMELRKSEVSHTANWDAYLDTRLKSVFGGELPLATAPTKAEFLDLYSSWNVSEAEEGVKAAEAIARLMSSSEDRKVFAGRAGEGWAKLCSEDPERCEAYLNEIQELLETDALKALQREYISVFSPQRLSVLISRQAPGVPASAISPVQRKAQMGQFWFVPNLPGEAWFEGEGVVPGKWGAGLPGAERDAILAARLEQANTVSDLLTYYLDLLPAGKKDFTDAELTESMRAFVKAHPQVYEVWKKEMLRLVEVARLGIRSDNAALRRDSYEAYRNLLATSLRNLTFAETLQGLNKASGEGFHKEIARRYLPGFPQFRASTLGLIGEAAMPNQEATQELISLEEQLAKLADQLVLVEQQGEDTTELQKEIERKTKKRAQAVVRYRKLTELKTLLRAFAADLPSAKRALVALDKLEGGSNLWGHLYQDARSARRKSARHDLSAKEIIEDLNHVASMSAGTLSTSGGTAKRFLEDLKNYCGARATDEAFRSRFDLVYEASLEARMEQMSEGRREELDRLRALAVSKSSYWSDYRSKVSGRWTELKGAFRDTDNSNRFWTVLEKSRATASDALSADWKAAMRSELPDASTFCGYIETQSTELVARLGQTEEDQTPDTDWLTDYWHLVNTASAVLFSRGSEFAPWTEVVKSKPRLRWFRGAPSDELTVSIDPQKELNWQASTPSLIEFFHQKPSLEVIEAMWPGDLLLQLGIAPLTEASLINPIAWMNTLSPVQRFALRQQMQSYFDETALFGGPGTDLMKNWVGLDGLPDLASREAWWKRLEVLARNWQKLSPELRVLRTRQAGQPKTARAARPGWTVLASALVRTLLQGTLYRIEGDRLVAAKADPDFSLRVASEKRLEELEATLDDDTLTRLAQSAFQITKTVQHRSELEGSDPALPYTALSKDTPLPAGAGFFTRDHGISLLEAKATRSIWNWMLQYQMRTQKGLSAQVAKPLPFTDQWAPQGKVADSKLQFEQWFELVRGLGADDAFAKLAKGQKRAGRPRLWHLYPSLAEMKGATDSAYAQAISFLDLWDRNAQASDEKGTYPYLLGLLNWHTKHRAQDIPMGVNTPALKGLPDGFMSLLLADVLAVLELPVDDFEGWKTPLTTKGDAIDWLAMAQSKKSYLVDVGKHRVYSALMETPASDINYTPFPVTESERSSLGTSQSFDEWYKLATDPERKALYAMFERNEDQVELFEALAEDGLVLQGEKTSDAPGKSATAQEWANYFALVASRFDPKKRAELVEEVKDIALLRDRQAYVAFRQAVSDPSRDRQLEKILKGYGLYSGNTSSVEAIGPTNRIARAIYLGGQITFDRLFSGKTDEQQKQIEKDLRAADTYYRLEAQTDTYWSGIQAVGKNILAGLEPLCKERSLVSQIKTPEEFEAAKDRIWNMRLPLMEGLMKVADEYAPPGGSDEPRRLMQRMLLQAEQDRQAAEKRDAWIGAGAMGLFAVFMLYNRVPALARLASKHPAIAAWGSKGVGMALGGYFGFRLSQTMDDDLGWGLYQYLEEQTGICQFVYGEKCDLRGAPQRVALMSQVRDSQLMGYLPLMTDEQASLRDEQLEGVRSRQRSVWTWLGYGLQLAITVDIMGVPVLRGLGRSAKYMGRQSRRLWAWKRNTLMSSDRRALAGAVKSKLDRTGSLLGETSASLSTKTPFTAAEDLRITQLEVLKRELQAWKVDDLLAPSQSVTTLLLKDLEVQAKAAAKLGQLNMATLESTATKPLVGPLLEMQLSSRVRLQFLNEVKARLTSATPHLSVDDFIVLLSKQVSPFERYRPWYFQGTGIYPLTPSVFKLSRLSKIADANVGAHHTLSYYFMTGWMDDARPLLESVAGKLEISQEQLLKDIVEGRLFVPTRAMTVGGDDVEALAEKATQLREIFKLGSLQSDLPFLKAWVGRDFEALRATFAKGPTSVIAGAGAMNVTTPVKPTAPVTTASAARDSSTVMQRLLEAPTSEAVNPIYRSFLEARIPAQVGTVEIDRQTVLNLIDKQTAQAMEVAVGRYLREFGAVPSQTLAQMRLAARLRRAVELDANAPSASSVSRFFETYTNAVLASPEKLMRTELSLTEAKAVLEIAPQSEYFTARELRQAADFAQGRVNGEMVESARSLLARFPRDDRSLTSLDDLMRALELPPEAFKAQGLAGRLTGNSVSTRGLSYEEFFQFKRLFSSTPPESFREAQSILRLSPPKEFDPEIYAGWVLKRSKGLQNELNALRGGSNEGEMADALRNVKAAETLMLKELGL